METVTGFVAKAGRVNVVALGTANPALFGHHHRHRVGAHNVQLTESLRLFPRHQRRTAVIAKLFRHRHKFFLDHGLQAGRTAQDLLQLIAFRCQFILLTTNADLFQLGQVTQFQIQYGFSLRVTQAEPRHQRRLGFVLGANNMNYFIDIEESDQIAFKDVQPLQHTLQTIFQPTANSVCTKFKPLPQYANQAFNSGTTIYTDHVQVDAVTAFQVGGRKQMVHQAIDIDPVRARHNKQARGVFMV